MLGLRHLAILAGLFAAVPAALADVVVMKNGDRLTGTVVNKIGSTLVFKTPYAGKISIKWAEVASLETDEPVKLIYDDETLATGVFESSASGDIQLIRQEAEEAPIDLEKVAHINPPKHVSGEGYTFSGNANLGIEVKRGNTDSDKYHLDGELLVRGKSVRYRASGEFNRELSQGDETENNWLVNGTHDRFFTEKWFLYTTLLFEHDEFKDLDLRSTIGMGPGYQFWESDKKNLSLEGGPSYVIENFDEGEDNDYLAARWKLDADYWLGDKVMQLFHTQVGLLAVPDTGDVVFKSRQGLRFPLTEHLQATFRVEFDWDTTTPSADTEEVDTRYYVTAGYKW